MTPPATFRPHERINDPTDFRRAFDRKRSASDAAMVVYGVENGRDHPRLGISVGRKKIRSAAARNRVKRLLREAFWGTADGLRPGHDFVIVARPDAGELAAERGEQGIAEALRSVLAEAGLVAGEGSS